MKGVSRRIQARGYIIREPESRQWTLTGAENAITLYAIGGEEVREEEKVGREKERRRGGSRFTHTKSRARGARARSRIVHDGNQTHKSEP